MTTARQNTRVESFQLFHRDSPKLEANGQHLDALLLKAQDKAMVQSSMSDRYTFEQKRSLYCQKCLGKGAWLYHSVIEP